MHWNVNYFNCKMGNECTGRDFCENNSNNHTAEFKKKARCRRLVRYLENSEKEKFVPTLTIERLDDSDGKSQ